MFCSVGIMGGGKLGLPVALAIEAAGHDTVVYDLYPERLNEILATKKYPQLEEGVEELLQETRILSVGIPDLVAHSDIIFVAVQTPHGPEYEGVTKLPETRQDFDYSYLERCITDLSAELDKQQKPRTVVVISTVLPGTMKSRIVPKLSKYAQLVYNPFFIAMGTVIPDFRNPEFVLVGVDGAYPWGLHNFYKTIHKKPILGMSIESAELTKVAYNTFISTKLAMVGVLQEICHKTPGCHIDHVTHALCQATDRLLSPKYMTAGMGDGGGCHPRDNIAMSWLAGKQHLGHDFFESIMLAREKQTLWFAEMIEHYAMQHQLPIVLLGKAFKPETNIVTGSPAILLANLLEDRGHQPLQLDPLIDDPADFYTFNDPAVFFIATRHALFGRLQFPKGSIVLDPHRYICQQNDVTVVPIGVGVAA